MKLALVGITVSGALLCLQQMPASELEAALRAGREESPAPYALKAVPTGSRNLTTTAVGFVFTPYIRVALLSAVARAANEELRADQIPPRMLEADIYVAVKARRWYEAQHCTHLESNSGVIVVAERYSERGRRILARGAQPLWSSDRKEDVRSYLQSLVPDTSEIGAIALFRKGAFRGNTVMIWHPLYDCGDGKKVGPEIFAYVGPHDPESWR